MSNTFNEIIERLIVIDRCLDNMFETAILPLNEIAEQLRDLGITPVSNDILTVNYAPQYASIMAIKPITDRCVFEEGNTEEIVRSGYYEAESETLDSTFSFELPYSYGEFAVILLTSVIELNNILVKIINSEDEEELSDSVLKELRQVSALTTIHRDIAEGDYSMGSKSVILNASFYARKNLNVLSGALDEA